jgi:histidinol-phosphate aminotransferase
MEPRDLSAHDAYEAGRGIEEVARELGRDPAEFVKLASNENPHGPSPRAVEGIRAVADAVHVYPTASHADLREAVAARWGVEPRQVWLANGADGAIDCLCRATLDPGDEALVPDPGFAYYPMSVRYHHGEVTTYELDPPSFENTVEAVLSAYDGERLVFLTSPHNPTGKTVTPAEIERVADATDEETLVAVDEAYGEYAALPSAATMVGGKPQHVEGLHDVADPGIADRDDVAVLRTFSKAYGLAGVRLGYAIAPPEWADAYARINTPFSAGEVGCRAGLAAIADDGFVRKSVRSAERAREAYAERIDARVVEGQGNFVLVEVGDGSRVAGATQRRGVIVRDCTSFGLPEYVRVTCGTESGTERAIEALNATLAEVEA